MPSTTPRGYPVFDPTGADRNLIGADYFNPLTGASTDSFVQTLDREQTEQDNKLLQHDTDIESLNDVVADIDASISQLEGTLSEHGSELSAHDAAISALDTDVADIDQTVSDQSDRIAQIEGELDGIDEAIGALGDELSAHIDDNEIHITEEERITWNKNDSKPQISVSEEEPTEPTIKVWVNPTGATSALRSESIGYANESMPDVVNAKQGIDSVTNIAIAAQATADAAFLRGNEVRGGLVSAIGGLSPDANFEESIGAIEDSKATLADNLTDKGVPSSADEPLADLAAAVAEIPVGGEGFDRVEELKITTSGVVTLPLGTKKIDFALVGGGGAGTRIGSYQRGGFGSGDSIINVYDYDLSGITQIPIVIGAGGQPSATQNQPGGAGGDTEFLGYIALGARGAGTGTATTTTEVINGNTFFTGRPLWGNSGKLVGGTPKNISSAASDYELSSSLPTDILAGGGLLGFSNNHPRTSGADGTGGGGGAIGAQNSTINTPPTQRGGSGYAEIICYIQEDA